jgi:cell division protein FtsB
MAGPIQTDRKPDEDDYDEKTEQGQDVKIAKIVKRFNRAESQESRNRQMAVEDLRFKAGDQWPEQVRASRTLEKRPCLTINKMKTFVHQITNDQRQNRPAINVSPVGDKSDPETAQMLKGLIRQIERQCNADVAYDTAFDNAVSNGWGYWRILTDYEDDDTFDQVVKIARIKNPFRVYLDTDSEEPDGSDAKWGFISDMIPREEFKEMFPDAHDYPWEEGGIGDEYKNWSTSSHIRIAEYFCVENEERKLVHLANGHVGFEDELDESLKDAERVDERDVQQRKIKWYKLTAKEILEEQDWPGKWIPIVKVIGDEIDIEGKTNLAGLIRDAKDAQRMYNFWVTSETELIALAPKAPWVMEEGQIEGHEQRWKEANNKSLPYLLYKGVNLAGKPAPPPQRQQFAGPPAGVVQAKISAAQDMQATTGIRFDATLQERTYDESGRALRELKRTGDLGNFHYVDNLSRSLKHTGRILIDLIPKIYDTPRVLTILREDGSEERVKVDPNLQTPHGQRQTHDGRLERLYNPKLGDYDVAVTVGPSFATKRAEAADSMLAFMKAVPQSGPLIGDLIAKNMDWPGAEEIGSRLASMLPPHLLDKKLDQLPPEAKALVSSLMQQMQQLKQEHDKAVAMLGDKEKDREIDRMSVMNDRESIAKDYEAKMTKVQADFEAKIAALQVKMAEGNGQGAHTEHQLAKVQADFEAKVAQMQLQFHTDLLKMGKDLQIAQMQQDMKAREMASKEPDLTKYDKENEKLHTQVKELEARMKDMNDIEIHFERDPKTNRIAKAKRVKRTTVQ